MKRSKAKGAIIKINDTLLTIKHAIPFPYHTLLPSLGDESMMRTLRFDGVRMDRYSISFALLWFFYLSSS